jgi:hypothetical protein
MIIEGAAVLDLWNDAAVNIRETTCGRIIHPGCHKAKK